MLNSLLLFGGSFGKNKKVARLISIILILNLIFVQVGQVKVLFSLFNIAIMAGITYFVRKISDKRVNAFMSIMSILIWSILIDVVSYFIFPLAGNLNILQYVFNGILFNARYVLVNALVFAVVEVISYVINKVTVNKVSTASSVVTSN